MVNWLIITDSHIQDWNNYLYEKGEHLVNIHCRLAHAQIAYQIKKKLKKTAYTYAI